MVPLGKEPPEFGCIEFWVDRQPVSLQAKGDKKREFKEFVSVIIKSAGFLLTGDIEIRIEWHIHEQKRYETDTSADTDNIIKPLIDALCGPSGIMIDDNQVQCITCLWIDSYQYDSEKIKITIKYFDDEFISKKGLVFINMGNNLCLPLCESNSQIVQNIIIDTWQQMFVAKKNLLSQGLDYYGAKGVMPIQRVFHKSRITEFKIIELEDKLAQIKS